jgi:hypothetical protein
VASYNAAVAGRPARRNGKTIEGIVDAYLDSQDFATKRDRTRIDYRKIARRIVSEFGDMPIAALADKRARGTFLEWRDDLAKQLATTSRLRMDGPRADPVLGQRPRDDRHQSMRARREGLPRYEG